MMKLTILGCGDAFSSGGRLPSSYMLASGQSRILIDCGPATLVGMKKTGIDGNSFSHIFISHMHGDHFAGLPFFMIDAMFPAERTTPLTIVGPPGLEIRTRLAFENFYPRLIETQKSFDLNFIEIEKNISHQIAGFDIEPFEVEHFSGGPSYALRFEKDGKIFAFSGDTGWTDQLLAAGKDADLYLMECFHYDLELPMHLNYQRISRNFDAIGARKIVLTHMAEAMLARQSDVDLNRFILAEDGLAIDF